MVLPASSRVSRAPEYSGYPSVFSGFRVRGSHPLCRNFPAASTIHFGLYTGPTTPTQRAGPVWAIPRSLATTWGVSIDFLSCGYLDVSVLRVDSACAVTAHDGCRVSPFGHLRFIARLPAHRSLSQAPTSFIVSRCQGIHRMPL